MDQEVEALRRLLHGTDDHPGGPIERRRYVAGMARCSADNLYQVAACIPLKSGRPRKIGRDVRERLEAAFPGWLGPPSSSTAHQVPPGPPELAEALPVVLEALGGLTAGQWRMVRARLDDMAGNPAMRDDVAADVLPLLDAPRKGRTGP